jgi:hypothetical protein
LICVNVLLPCNAQLCSINHHKMKTNSIFLLQQLLQTAQKDLQYAQGLAGMPQAILSQSPEPGAWSALQCLEHLNLYAAFYLPELQKALGKAGAAKPQFTSGLVGNMLVNMVVPKKNNIKMKTLAAMRPTNNVGQEVLHHFISYHRQLIAFLQAAENVNLNHRGVAVTFTSLVKMRLGDALRFMVYHHSRHILQAQRALETAVKS